MGATRAATAIVVVAVGLAACGPTETPSTVTDDETITVASYDFDESELIGDLYTGALRSAGLEVRHIRRVGAREVVLPALERGLIEVVPEYAGSAVAFLGGEPSSDPASSHETLRLLLGQRGIDALRAAPAQSRNGLVVTSQTAVELALHTISDLEPVASQMTLGGPPDCPDRDLCLPGFTSTYGLQFASFLPLDSGGPITAEAVERGTVDVGVLFTSDGSLSQHDLVLLRDDRRLQPAENVTPLVRRDTMERFGAEMVDVLGALSSELTTEELRTLNADVRTGTPPRVVAAGWLEHQGFADPDG